MKLRCVFAFNFVIIACEAKLFSPRATPSSKVAGLCSPPPLEPKTIPVGTTKNNFSNIKSKSKDLAAEVIRRFQNELDTIPLVVSRQTVGKASVDIRLQWAKDGKSLITFCEVRDAPVLPKTFEKYFENIATEVPKCDAWVEKVTELETEEGDRDGDVSRQGIKYILYAPFPCSNRIFVAWKYLHRNYQSRPQEHLLVMTDRDNEGLMERHRTAKEKKSLVVAKATVAWWVQPNIQTQGDDKVGHVVGSHVRYLLDGDIGGNIPKWIQKTIRARGAYGSVHGLISFLHEQEKQQNAVKSDS